MLPSYQLHGTETFRRKWKSRSLYVTRNLDSVATTDFVLSPVNWVRVLISNVFNILFENRVLRRIFRPNRYEVTGGWRTFHNEQLRNFHFLSSIIRMITSRMMRWAGYVARLGKKRNAYSVLIEKPERRRQLRRPRRRWENDIEMDLREIGWGGMDWINLSQGRD
jgi:hypothetical protein